MVRERILATFPKVGETKHVEGTLQEMTNLSSTALFSLCGRAVAGQLTAVQDWLNTLKNGRAPTFGHSLEGDLLLKAQLLLANFAVFPAGASSSSATPAQGMPAVLATLESIEATVNEEGAAPANLSDLRPLHMFRWLLAVDEQKRVDDLANAFLSQAGLTNVGDKKEQDKASKRKPPKTDKATGKVVGESLADSYFS